jgi:hypothetical protein
LKKAVSIVLLSFFLFNTIGYKLLFYYQVLVADSRMEAKIENLQDSDPSLFTVKIPIRLPYHTDWKDYESVEGEVTYHNTTYRYVKQKVFRDTLILLCVNYPEKSQIRKNYNDYFKKVNDLTSDSSKKQVLKQASDDFYQKSESFLAKIYPITISGYSTLNRVLKTSSFIPTIEVPPDQIS